MSFRSILSGPTFACSSISPSPYSVLPVLIQVAARLEEFKLGGVSSVVVHAKFMVDRHEFCSLVLKFANNSDLFSLLDHNHHLYQLSDSETPSCCSFLHRRSPFPQPPTALTCPHPILTPLLDVSSGCEEMRAAAGAEPTASMPVAPLAAAAMPEVAPDSLDFLDIGGVFASYSISIHSPPHAGFVKALLPVRLRLISFSFTCYG
jgi:hypothetical protein